MEPLSLVDDQFKDARFQTDLHKESLWVAIEFWSFRCEECRMMAPIVSQIAQEFSGKLRVFKVNVDDNPRVVSEYAVPLVPYLIILKRGWPIVSLAEVWDLKQIRTILEEKA